MSIKIRAVLALAVLLAAVASAYGSYQSPEATISRTPGGPSQRFN